MTSDLSAPAARLPFLDWVRVLAVAVLVFYHVGMFYVTWDWHVKSPHASTLLEPWMRLSSPWRMDLLFLVSGAATSLMLLHRGASSALLGSRARRLLLPLLFGVLVIVPPQSWLEVVHKLGYAGSYPNFMGLYLRAYGGFCFAGGQCLILPTWNHLWFLPYLFVYTLVAWLALRWRPALLHRFADSLPRRLAGWRLLWWPIVWLLLTRLLLRDRFPPTHALVDDWFAHSQYLAMFLLGAALAGSPQLWLQMARIRWPALLLALLAWALLVAGQLAPGAVPTLPTPLRPLLISVQQWCAVIAALGFARRHLNHDSRLLRYLNDAVFPLYILHQTTIVLLAYWMAQWRLAPALEGLLLVAATFALGWAGYAGIRRVGWLRPWFGLRSAGSRESVALRAAQ